MMPGAGNPRPARPPAPGNRQAGLRLQKPPRRRQKRAPSRPWRGARLRPRPRRQNPAKKPQNPAFAEVDETLMNPLITHHSVGSNDAGPQSAGEGVALPLGTPFRDAGTGR